MTTQQMLDQAIRYSVYLERLKTREVRDFNRVFDNVDRKLKDLLYSLDSPELSAVSRAQIERIVAEFERATVKLGAQAIGQHLERMEDLAGVAQDFNARMLRAASKKGEKLAVRIVKARDAMAKVLREPMKMDGNLLEPWLNQMNAKEARRLSIAVRQGWANGETVQATMKRILGTKSANYRDGVMAMSKREAATAIRTSMSHVNTASQTVFMEENNDIVEGYRWVATLDGSTSAICRSLDGRVFKLTDKKAPKPPMHPNERSVTVPDLGDEFDFLDEGATRSSVNGPVDQKTTYYEWLKTQDADFQAGVLGKTRAKVFRDGGISADDFASLNLNRNFEEITLQEMRDKMPSIFKKAGIDRLPGDPDPD